MSLTSCINLSRLLPISKLEQNINAISSLVYNDDDLLENFLQKVDQPLIINPEKGFICCEYNRDGDSYREPGTTTYYPPLESGTKPTQQLLDLEKMLNTAFKEYIKMYYTSVGTNQTETNTNCSVYCYEMEEGNPDEFIVAILIKNKIKGQLSNKDNGQWESSNLVTVKKDGQKISYDLITSVNVYLNVVTEKTTGSQIAIGGSSTKNIKKEFTSANIDNRFHMEKIGPMIEDMETSILSEINAVYFGKTQQIIAGGRDSSFVTKNIDNIRKAFKGA